MFYAPDVQLDYTQYFKLAPKVNTMKFYIIIDEMQLIGMSCGISYM